LFSLTNASTALIAFEKGLEVGSFVSTNVPISLMGDAGRINQVITNLVSNAVKFCEKGNITVTAKLVEENPETVTLYVKVKGTFSLTTDLSSS
jgi:signal transduction histidine kinase